MKKPPKNHLAVSVLLLFLWLECSFAQKHYPYALGRHIPQILVRKGYNSSAPHPCEQKSCYPATGNLLIGREKQLWASSTCGTRRREKFCIVSHLKDSKKCFYCESNERTRKNPKLNHEVRNVIYKYFPGTREESWWQSENGKENVTIQLDLEAEFHFTHLIIVFKTFRPAAMLIERSYDFGKTWQVYRYFASDCHESFPGVPSETLKRLTDVICESRYSKVSPSENGEVIFRVLPPQMLIENPYKEEVQNLLKMTNLRINFTKLHTLGDDLLDRRAEIQEKYYYAITNMVVRGSCSCYGHASSCLPLEEDPTRQYPTHMVHGRCACVHNTKGANCEECENFFNDLPWQPAIGKQSNACKRCNCNNHADSCHFDAAVYQASGNISGGVCDGCKHNTTGTHCEMCKPFFYHDPSKSIQDPEACVPCDCDPNGSLDNGICDSLTDKVNEQEAGKCHCKTNVDGRRCDVCKNGYWNFTGDNPDGCQTCTCNTLGTIDNHGCDMYTGECTCKRYVTGRDCNQCLPEYWGLSEKRDGCQPCDCDPGGAYDNNCDVISGQCRCRENVQGRRCDQPKQYYFAPSLEYMIYEAEHTIPPDSNQNVIREPFRDGRENTWTGTGFVNVPEHTQLTFDIDKLPRTMEYDIVIRYEPKMPDVWENAIIQIIRPEPIDPNGPCANTKPSDDRTPIVFHPNSRTVTVVPPTCLETNKAYRVIIEMRRYKSDRDTPSASILIDSIVLRPRIDRLPMFRDPHITESRIAEYNKYCQQLSYQDILQNNIPDICKKYQISTSLQVFNGAYPCNCNDTGSTSKLCSEYGGFCQCKPRVVGRQCDQCAPGTYGFGPEGCKPCDCSGLGSRDNFCDPISGQCKCINSNTYGRQCDQCRPGFWAFPDCQRCECNGHADICDPRSGACINCRDSTLGHNCEHCIDGYYGDPRIGYDIPCRPCPCPGPLGSDHSHADTCALDPATKDVVCECHEGYAGSRCDFCDDNYFGHPEVAGGICQECDCNNNIDITRPGNCNPLTGQCLQCLFNTEGDHCEYCRAGYYGDAVNLQNCRECVCNILGTDLNAGPCNRTTGQCPCKKNVIGLECDECEKNHWRIALGNGCEPCDCDPIGSTSEQCNVYDGQCTCKPGFGGRQCNQCTENHWGNPTVQCYPCDCDPYGSQTLQCDQNNGSCVCIVGISGEKCNKCARGFVGTAPRCSPCGECFTNWDMILDERKAQTKHLIREVQNTIQVGTPGAYSQQFDSMESTIDQVRDILNKTSVSLKEAEELENNLNWIQNQVNETEKYVNVTTKEVNDITNNITIGTFNLQPLEAQMKELKQNAEKLRNNATTLQESDVELARTLTEAAKQKVDNLVENVAAAQRIYVQAAEQNCKAAEALVNRTKPEKFEENQKNLDDLQNQLNGVLRNISLLNEDICDRKDDNDNEICDSICGGAGCGKCGGVSSCDEGAVFKVQNADELAKEASTLIRNNELKAEQLLRNLSQIYQNTTRVLEDVKTAYDQAQKTNNTANDYLNQVNEIIQRIKNLNATSKDSPKELQDLVNKILTLKISSKPEDIQELADKITKAVTTLTDIEAILRETEDDKNRVKQLQQSADLVQQDAEDVLQQANDVTKALDEAEKIQQNVTLIIDDVEQHIEDVKQDLDEISQESDVAQDKANESVSQVESLQQRLQSLKVQFLKNNRDAQTVESDASKIVQEAFKAQTEASELQSKYLEANKQLTKQIQQSQNIRDRAKDLYFRATELNVNISGKMDYLKDLSSDTRAKEEKLKALSQKIDSLNREMDEYLSVIRARSTYYRACST